MKERTQFSGSAMQVTPHFHSLVPDGVLVPQEGDVRFAALPPPWQAHSLQQRLRWTEMDVQRPLPDGTPHLLFTGLELFVALTGIVVSGGGLLYRSLRGQEQPLPAPGRAILRRYRTRAQAGLKGAQRSVTIQKPANEIHRAWRAEGSLPQVMGHFAEVTELSPDRHRWKVRGPPGTSLEWESHIVEEHSGELLRWEAVEGAVLPNEGLLRFLPAPVDRGTVVTLRLRFDPPAGPAGDAMMRLLGDVGALALKALRRFKSLAEAGEIPATHFTPAARDGGYSD